MSIRPITIADRVAKVIAEQFGAEVSQVTPEKTLVEDLHADSLDRVELAMAIEDEFDIELLDESIEACTTVASFTDLVTKALALEGRS